MSKKRILTVVMWGVSIVSVVVAVVADEMASWDKLPQWYSDYASAFVMVWYSFWVAYNVSLTSQKTRRELLKDVIVIAVGVSAVRIFLMDDGSWAYKCTRGVNWFLRVAISGAIGVSIKSYDRAGE